MPQGHIEVCRNWLNIFMHCIQNNLRIGIYVGEGASHSWTWFVDLLEKYAYGRLQFIEEHNFDKAMQQDILLVSGGDTFGVAGALGDSGAETLQKFMDQGGLYIGSCAGAYLPLNSSKEPLSRFNFVKARINNLTRDLPPAHRLPLKFSNRYGCSYVFHPVREEVRIQLVADHPVWPGKEIRVPLYGGPPLQLSDDIQPKAYYCGFTEHTAFLTDREVAEKVYLGKIAACEKQIGEGRMLLLGPHFEHPWFPEGNEIIHAWIQYYASPMIASKAGEERQSEEKTGKDTSSPLRALKIAVSNMRIRAQALNRQSIHWQIGAKIYEPEKIEYFVETIWKRLSRLKGINQRAADVSLWEDLAEKAEMCHVLLKELDGKIREQEDSQELASAMFRSLKSLTVAFLEVYFYKGREAEIQ